MADKKLSQLTALTGAGTASGDLLYIVDVSEPVAADQSKKITLTEFQSAPISAGTANGVAFLDGSKVLTTGSALTFDGTTQSSPVYQATTGAPGFSISNQATGPARSQYVNNGGTFYFGLDSFAGGLSTAYAVNYWYTGNYPHVWALNNAEQMRLTSTGLGIGTSSPRGLLDLNTTRQVKVYFGTAGTIGETQTTAGDYVANNLYVSAESAGTMTYTKTTDDSGNAIIQDYTRGITFYTGVTGATSATGTLNNFERMRLDTSGNLGIGTSSPAYKLDVTGTINSGASSATGYNLVFRTSGITTGRAQTSLTNTSGDFWTGIEGSTAGQTLTGSAAYSAFAGTFTANPLYLVTNSSIRATLDSSGNLGLGVTPSAWNGSFFKPLEGGDSDNQSYVGFRTDANSLNIGTNNFFNTSNQYVYKFNGAASRFDVNAHNFAWSLAPSGTAGDAISFSQVMTLDASGNLGIGTSSPQVKLEVSDSSAGAVSTRITNTANVSQYLSIQMSGGTAFGVPGWDNSGVIEAVADGVGSGTRALYLSAYNGPLIFATGSGNRNERARITSGGTFETSLDASIYGVTVGRGAGAVSTNTAVGASALAANTSGANNTAVGQLALNLETTGVRNVALGARALAKSVGGNDNTALGYVALSENTTGVSNTAVGEAALGNQTTGSNNTAVGMSALLANTTASNNTAVGYQAGYSNTTGAENVFFGYQAGYSTTTGALNTFLGRWAGKAVTTGNNNLMVGINTGYQSTGSDNTFVGARSTAGSASCAEAMTTGSKNTILGAYTGNQGGLDIRTSNNYIVLSDGDGNPKLICDGSGNWGVYAIPSTWFSSGNLQGASFGISQIAGFDQTAWSTGVYQPTYTGVWKHKGGYLGTRYDQTGSAHTFYTDNSASTGAGTDVTWAKVLDVQTAKSLALEGATCQTGTGITFPATQSASSNANTLDDYERGTFTATLKGGTTDPTTPVTATCQYSKIGRTVNVYIGFEDVNTTGASGGIQVSGLPFAASSTVRTIGTAGSFLAATFPADTYLIGTISLGGSVVDIQYIASNAGWAAATHNTGTGRYLWAQFTYETAT